MEDAATNMTLGKQSCVNIMNYLTDVTGDMLPYDARIFG